MTTNPTPETPTLSDFENGIPWWRLDGNATQGTRIQMDARHADHNLAATPSSNTTMRGGSVRNVSPVQTRGGFSHPPL